MIVSFNKMGWFKITNKTDILFEIVKDELKDIFDILKKRNTKPSFNAFYGRKIRILFAMIYFIYIDILYNRQ